MRALLKLGKTCISEDAGITLNRAEITGFDLDRLDRASSVSSSHKYLNQGKSGQYIFLYHAYSSTSSPVHVFALFTSKGPVRLHIVDSAQRRQAIPRLQPSYEELLKQRSNSLASCLSVQYPSTSEFTTTYHGNDVTALKAISRELGVMDSQSSMVVISSSKDQSYFDINVQQLSKFAVLSMPKTRSSHSLDAFPWQTNVAQKMFSRYLSMGPWLDRSIALADYYDVPVGHIEGDQPLLLADIEFARRLTEHDIVLWWSPGDRPDLGGVECDKRPTEELPRTEFLSPGSYSNVCLEVTVRNLAVNAVLHSVIVNELEGSGGATAFDSTRNLDEYAASDTQRDLTLGESHVSPQTFSILKSMVKAWLLDKIVGESKSPATIAVDHFWRWISSSTSNLYDPALHRFIHGLMRKTFIQMLAEFKRLGSHVVYADLSRILLVTSKPPGTAHAYATYINTAVTSHELFQHVFLQTTRFYDFLLFMDQANFAGVVCEDPLATEPPEQLSIEMCWNIQGFLPAAIQPDFKSAVRFFLIEFFKAVQKNKDPNRAPLRVLENGAPDATQHDAGKVEEREVCREFISRKLTRKLLKMLGNIVERHRDAVMDEAQMVQWEFPLLPGSHLTMTHAPLEWVKFVCTVLGLAKEYTIEVGLAKRTLLELIGVREFAADAAFQNPCESLVLANVPCRHCDRLRDFDFCRDPELLPSSLEVHPRWICEKCKGEYDRTMIEFALIEMVHNLERRFAQQDLRCTRCKQIQSDNLSRHCQCSGNYQLTTNKTELRRKLRTIVNVSIAHQLARLKVSYVLIICNMNVTITGFQEVAQTMLNSW